MADGVFQTSFAAGELSPNLYAREDIEKYSSGAALMRNFFVDYRGGASNRPGTEYLATCYDPTGITRVIPFIFSSDQSYVLEFSNLHCRIYQFGIAIADITTIWPASALFLLKFVQSADVMTIVHPDYLPYNLSRTALTTFTLDPVVIGATIAAPTGLAGTPQVAGAYNYGYVVTALTEGGEESLASAAIVVASAPLDPTHATPKTNALTWDPVAGAEAYNIYKWGPIPTGQPEATLYGYIGQQTAEEFTDTNIAPDYARVPPEFRDPFEDDKFPSVVTYYQQRRWYGGSDAEPEVLRSSQIGSYDNFDVSPAVLDSDAITINIASRQVNTIKALVPMSTGMIVFTTGCAFLVAGGNDNTVVTPSSVSAVPQASTGSNDIPPITVNYNILFVQDKGTIVRDMAFSFQTQSYYGVDRSMLANHLFFGFSIVDWAWAEEPYKLLWVIRNDGKALTMTYVPDQEVYGWARHDTNGLFKSVCAIPESGQDAVYFVVSRYIQDTEQWTNYLERLSFRTCDCPADAAYLDSFVGLPRTAPQGTLYVTINGDLVNMVVQGGDSFDSAYVMEAKQNYSPSMQTIIDTNPSGLYENIYASQTFTGDSFDPVRRQFIYSACQQLTADGTTKPHSVWDGAIEIPSGDDIFTSLFLNFHTIVRDIDSETVESFEAYNTAQLVPAGIGGGDGTWRRYMDTYAVQERQIRRLIDPRTGNLWQHTYGDNFPCGLYLLRPEDDYQQIISPVSYVSHMEICGLTDDWLYFLMEPASFASWFEKLRLIPREITAEETTADELLVYASFDTPAYMQLGYTFRWTLDFDGNVWFFSRNKTGTREYKLTKFEPPTSAPYGGPTVGGGFTDVSPWTSSTGPNANVTGYTLQGGNNWNKSIMFAAPQVGSTTLDLLVMIAKFQPNEFTFASTDPALLRWDTTYYNITTTAFETYEGFVTGYMKADWTPAADIDDDAAYVVIDCQEVNFYQNANSFNYKTDEGTTALRDAYARRWFFFTVQKVVDGAWTYDAAENHTVIVQYAFALGAAPTVVITYDEDLWYADYSYTGFSHPMNSLMNALGQSTIGLPQFFEWGVYDDVSNSFWWGGPQSAGGNRMDNLDPDYANRGFNAETNLSSSLPLLRIGFGTELSGLIDIGCGTVQITSAVGDTIIGVLEQPIANEIANDPFNTIAPIPEGDWFLTQSANTIDVSHLKGMYVGLVVDGMVYPQQIVPESGIITWPAEYATTRAVCGLPYQSQIQTMYLTTGEPTTQGRYKLISEVIVRVTCTQGIKVGPTFDDLVECKESMVVPYTAPPETFFQGDLRTNVPNDWNEYGQFCLQQDYPLPATILGVIPQVTVGDDD